MTCNHNNMKLKEDRIPDVLEKSWQQGDQADFQPQLHLHTASE